MFERFEKADSPPSFAYDSKLRKLTVRGVTEFPQEVFEYADQLEVLDMSNNQLTSLPDDLGQLKNVRIAFFSGNPFHEVPPVLAACERLEMVGLKSCGIEVMGDDVLPPTLRGLILTDNNLAQLPHSIGEYASLQKLMLTGNRLTVLPETLLQLKKLELMRVAGNQLPEPPHWLSALANLAWYSDSENCFNPAISPESLSVKNYAWSDMTLGEKLGESAKNTVHSATLQNGSQVAVKLFGKGVTTDGSPDNDIVAALLAGDHPNLIGGLGRLVATPNGEQGLVMPYIPSEYKVLGLPPDFSSLTRDVYPERANFSLSVVIKIANDIASALQHLHAKGVMHGDIYAHNILFKSNGESKLGDFGAASVYTPGSPPESWRKKVDVMGYGHLIDELTSRIVGEIDARGIDVLRNLANSCLGDIHARPTFVEINEVLHSLRV